MSIYSIYRADILADTYGGNSFGDCNYSSSCATTTTAGKASDGNGLINTGIAIGVFVTIACMVVLLTILVRVLRRTKPAAQEVLIAEEVPTAQDADSDESQK